jgi:uncharacterized membrane protein
VSEGSAPNDTPGGSPNPSRVSIQSVTTIAMQGPLPPPAMFEYYEKVLPGAAERILRLAEVQASHRRNLETSVIGSDIRRAGRGQILGFVLALGTVLGGFALIAGGRRAEGLASVILSTASLAAVFMMAVRTDQLERERKISELESLPPGEE